MIRACLLAAAIALSAAAEPGGLDVVVGNIRSAKGDVRVAVCDKAHFLQETCAYRGHVPARPGEVAVHIAGIPPGIYAAQAFQDENSDGKIDRTFFGLPREGIGFSNDAPMRFGPPSFADAMFSVGAGGGRVAFALRYFK